jgi:hypothetical protein
MQHRAGVQSDRAPLPGVAITSARLSPSLATSSAVRATAPGANTTRCGVTSWMKEIFSLMRRRVG